MYCMLYAMQLIKLIVTTFILTMWIYIVKTNVWSNLQKLFIQKYLILLELSSCVCINIVLSPAHAAFRFKSYEHLIPSFNFFICVERKNKDLLNENNGSYFVIVINYTGNLIRYVFYSNKERNCTHSGP